MSTPPADSTVSRRSFIRTSSGAAIAPAVITAATTLRAQQKADSKNETLKIGLIGCGGRGTGAAANALGADYNSKLVAVADAFETQADASIAGLSAKFADRVTVAPEKKFIGLDAYQKLLASDVDVVILATPPGFRPLHLTAAVEAGKNIFCEKPMAVDATGYRMAMEAVRKAKEKKLNLVAGFCWRYATSRIEAFKRVQDGAIGPILASFSTYYTGPVKPMQPASGRPPGMGDVEWQMKNWYNFSWLCGDSIVEQAVHSIDKIVWAMGDKAPLSCIATGGRQIPSEGGNIFDHFHAAYEWDGGIIAHLGCRQITGCQGDNSDYFTGTKGRLIIKSNGPVIDGEQRWRFRGEEKSMYDLEHDAFFSAIRKGEVINNGDRMMLSTLVAIMGREAAYTGQRVVWEAAPPAQAVAPEAPAPKKGGKQKADGGGGAASLAITTSKQDLAPDTLKFTDSFDAGPVPRPGVTKFV
ncbi:MAG: Gfo/Idh/MocA family oxidoreductase [Verrucomicrobiaceae bacterium]|nr:Gfo/Idh/MocA family oxidoreductase [Verrucomicrobiaceae bacterium]